MKKELLIQVYRHATLSADERQQIIDAHEFVRYEKGDFILKHGQQSDCYLIMETGLMRAYLHDFQGRELTTDFFCDHELIIEVLSLFKRIPATENIQAITDCTCWKIDFGRFQELFRSLPGFAEWGRLWMTNSLFHFKQRSIDMVAISAKERYLQLIKEKPQVLRQAQMKHIASYLGITDTSFSRIRKELA